MSMPGWCWPDDGPYTDCERCHGPQVRMRGERPYLCDDCAVDAETVELLQADMRRRVDDLEEQITKRNLMAWMLAYGRCDVCGRSISRGSVCTDCAAELGRR